MSKLSLPYGTVPSRAVLRFDPCAIFIVPCIDAPDASGHFAGCGVSRNISLQNPAGALLADDHSITRDNLAPGDRHHRPSRDLEALPRRVVGAMMQVRLSDRLATVRVPQGDIGVEADADRPLAGVETRHLGVIGRGQLDKPVQRNSARRNAFRKQDRQPRFDAGNAIRDPAKRRPAFGRELAFAALVSEWAVMGG